MGLVFRGHHRDQGVPVAVKVIEQKDGEGAKSFRNEIRAMAGLDHPGVVWVFDVGEVPERVERQTSGQLTAGAPYIAMEYASRGTLHDLIGKLLWEDLYDILLELLDALAHAHARGVVHRDLKPGNVLLCGPEDLRPGLKLADFGIAHAVEKTEVFSMSGGSKAIGTLHYMAPEQIRADIADYGPWTDIYALGHMIWHIVMGHVAFKGRSGMALCRTPKTSPT
jgi:serine/threonine protein kinase